MKGVLAVLISLPLFAGCLTPHPPDGSVRCNHSNGAACPSGYFCDPPSDTCWRNGHVPPQVDMSASIDAGGDLAASDGPSNDMTSLKTNGDSCATNNQCTSGNCVDGVCCESECTGACKSCAVPGALGKCQNAPQGSNARSGCSVDAANKCGTDGVCDGSGQCELQPQGTVCAPKSCSNGTLTNAAACDGKGTCQTATTRACSPYICKPDNSDCYPSCTSGGSECASPNVCSSGSCGKASQGAACNPALNGGDCVTGHCVDGVCCDSACGGLCQTCSLGGSVGTCSNIPANTASSSDCPTSSKSTCGTDGTCNGNGACHLWAIGTICVPQSCANGNLTQAAACNGNGTCAPPTTKACSPYVCKTDGSDCYSTCTAGGSECLAPNVCTAGVCGKAPDGATCNPSLNGTDCVSGNCVDGVCCKTSCSGLCQACNLSGNVGSCKDIPPNTPSPTDCPTSSASTCGTDGTCDGSGNCHLWSAGTVCVSGSCPTVTTYRPPQTCNGSGTCSVAAAPQNCSPYSCNASTGCYGNCNAGPYCYSGIDNGKCDPSFTCNCCCNSMTCAPQYLGKCTCG